MGNQEITQIANFTPLHNSTKNGFWMTEKLMKEPERERWLMIQNTIILQRPFNP